jgi:hypothetical protein
MTDERCSKKLWSDYQCSHKGIVCRDGKWYCKKHDPGDPEKDQTWWHASALSYRIDPVQVLSATASTVLLKDRSRQYKDNASSWIRPTFEEAKACLVAHLEREVTRYARRLKRAEQNLESARKLEQPTNDPNNRI